MGRPEELQAEARSVLALLEPLGPLVPTGSFVSGLMVWRDLDLMLLGGSEFSPGDALALLARVAEIPGVTGFSYLDQRGGEKRDERYLVTITLGEWRVDLSIWLHDDHADVSEWHRELAGRLSGEDRQAILAIKSLWHQRPEYPDEVCGFDIYTAVLEDGVRTAVEFGAWLRDSPKKR